MTVYVPDLLPNSALPGPIEVDTTGIIANRELQIATDCYAVGCICSLEFCPSNFIRLVKLLVITIQDMEEELYLERTMRSSVDK